MTADLSTFFAALADLSDAELRALIKCTYRGPQIAPGFLAWLDTACDWEEHRRRDTHFPLLPPESAIPAGEGAASITAVAVLRHQFASVPTVAALFEAIAGLLKGGCEQALR